MWFFDIHPVMKQWSSLKLYKKHFALHGILAPSTGFITRGTLKNQILILEWMSEKWNVFLKWSHTFLAASSSAFFNAAVSHLSIFTGFSSIDWKIDNLAQQQFRKIHKYWVYTVCSGLSVQKLRYRIITIYFEWYKNSYGRLCHIRAKIWTSQQY